MNVQGSTNSATIINNSQHMMETLSKGMRKQQELANKMITLSIEAKVAHGKNQLLGKLVDVNI